MLRHIVWLMFSGLLLLIFGPVLVAGLFANIANLEVLSASTKCHPQKPYVQSSPGLLYPPVECRENAFLLAQAYHFYQVVLGLDSASSLYREHAIEVAFAHNQLAEAAEKFGKLPTLDQRRSQLLKPGSFVFHILSSRIEEEQGYVPQAISDAEIGLRLSSLRWSNTSIQAETVRLAQLYAKSAQSASRAEVNSDLYQAGLYAACASDWPTAQVLMQDITQTRGNDLQTHLTVTQTAVSELVVKFAEWRSMGSSETQPANLPSSGAGLGSPVSDDPYLWLGERLLEKDSNLCWQGALAVFQGDAAMMPQSGLGAFRAAGIMLEHIGWHSAREYYYLAATREPQNAQFAFELGMNLSLLGGDTTGALPWLQKAFDLNPKAVYAVRLAQAHEAVGQHQEALFYADRSMELPPEDDWVRFWAARIYAENGQTEAARHAFESALSMNPKNEQARNGLAALAEK